VNIETVHRTECALLRVSPRAAPAPFAYAAKKQTLAPGPSAYCIGCRITYVDRAIIRRFFDDHHLERQESHQRSGRQLRSVGRLAHRSRVEQLPAKLEYKLSRLNAGYQRVLVDGDVMLIEPATRRIVDVMHNAAAFLA